jgi:hypothetical protein
MTVITIAGKTTPYIKKVVREAVSQGNARLRDGQVYKAVTKKCSHQNPSIPLGRQPPLRREKAAISHFFFDDGSGVVRRRIS